MVVVMETRHFYVPTVKAWFPLRGGAEWKLVDRDQPKRGKVKIPSEVLAVARSHGKSQLEYLSECELDGYQSKPELERILKEAGAIKIQEFTKWHAAQKLANEELERIRKIEEHEQLKDKMIEDHTRDVAKSMSCDQREVDSTARSADEILKALKEGTADKTTIKRAVEHSNFLRNGILRKFEDARMKAVSRAVRKHVPLELLEKMNPRAWKRAQLEQESIAAPKIVDSEQLKKLNGGCDVDPINIHDDNNDLFDPECDWSMKGAYDATILEDLRTEGKSREEELVYTQEAQDVETPEDVAEERDIRGVRTAATVAELVEKVKREADFINTGAEQLIRKHNICFTRTETGVKTKFKVELIDKDPVCNRIRYKFNSPAKKQMLREMLEKMIAKNEIGATKSPWCSPIFLVPKKTPGKCRLIFDGREISKKIRKDAYPVPAIADLLEDMALKGVDVVSTIDLKDFFFQFKLDESSSEIFAFNASDVGLGMLAYKVLPQGIAIAPALAQRALTELLDSCSDKHSGVAVFCDDVCFYSSDPDGDIKKAVRRHHELLDKALGRLCEAGFMVDAAKSHFFKKTAAWLGFRVGEGMLRPLDDYLEKLHKCAGNCKDKKDVRRTIGLLGYYSRFVRSYATKIEPLTRLTKNSVSFEWGKEQQDAVDEILMDMAENSALTLPDYEAAAHDDPTKRRPFIMYTDASDVGAGGVLMQAGRDGVLRIVAFESKTFSDVQRNWDTTHREWFALQHCMIKWRPYLEGTHFLAYTDHAALVPVLSKRYFDTPWQARWALKLQDFSFTLRHVQGLANAVADAASRRRDAPILKILKIEELRKDREQTLAEAEREMDKLVESELGVLDRGMILAPKAIPRFLPSQQNKVVVAQRNDPVISAMLKFPEDSVGFKELAKKNFPNALSNLQILDLPRSKLLVFVEKGKESSPRWVVPAGVTRAAMRAMHGEGLCHMSADSMEAISEHLWWPNKRNELRDFVRQCPKCRMNPIYKASPPPRSVYPDQRGQAIAMDLMFIDEHKRVVKKNPSSVFGATKKQLKHKLEEPSQAILLVAVDVATRYPFVTVLPDKTAVSSANAILREVVSHLGTPKRFISDQGGEFANNLFDTFFARRGTHHYLVGAGNSEANGIVERLNGSLRPMIEFIRDKWPETWKEKLSAAVYCARNRPHRALGGFTPAQMMFGMTPRSLHAAEWLHDDEITENLNNDAKAFYDNVKDVTDRLEAFSLKLREDKAVKERLKAYLKIPSTRVKDESFEAGDRVYVHLREDGLKNKKSYKLGRPAEVVRPVNKSFTTYEVLFEDADPKTRKPVPIPAKQLSHMPNVYEETTSREDDMAQQGGVSDADLWVEFIV